MPRKPKHPCAHPGCPELVEAGERFCRAHAKQAARDYERYGRDPQVWKKKYNYQWKKTRAQYIKAHPLCEECLKDGRAVPATEVHHRVPLADGGDNRPGNLEALCKHCHSKIHAKRGDRWKK